MTVTTRQPLGQLLVDRGLVQAAQLEGALEEQRRSGHLKLLGEILVETKSCTEAQVAEILAEAQGIPYAAVGPLLADAAVLPILPRAFIDRHGVLPLFLVEDVLTVALTEPADMFVLEEVRRLTGRKLQVVATTAAHIADTLRRHDPSSGRYVEDASAAVDSVSAGASFEELASPGAHAAELNLSDIESAASKMVAYSIRNAVKEGASEIHIEPGSHSLRIRYRIDGRLSMKHTAPAHLHAPVVQRLKSLANMPMQATHPLEGPLQLTLDRKDIALNLCTMPGPLGEKVVIRLSEAERAMLNLEKLGLAYETLKQWKKLISRPSGLIAVSGVGRTSTLYASLTARNHEHLNVCTLEDPVAMTLEGINQFAVNTHAELGFAEGLRAVLRQEPDLLMLGDLPDAPTAQLAAQAALAGRLVLAATHAHEPAGVVGRLLQLGIDPYVLSMTLSGVLVQRLVRKLCPACKQAGHPTQSQRRQLEKCGVSLDTVYEPKGCERCRDRGYTGRIGLFELLVPDEQMAQLIARGAGAPELRATIGSGHATLLRDGIEKVKAGVTSFDELFRITP